MVKQCFFASNIGNNVDIFTSLYFKVQACEYPFGLLFILNQQQYLP